MANLIKKQKSSHSKSLHCGKKVVLVRRSKIAMSKNLIACKKGIYHGMLNKIAMVQENVARQENYGLNCHPAYKKLPWSNQKEIAIVYITKIAKVPTEKTTMV